jgi:hypothetical protein
VASVMKASSFGWCEFFAILAGGCSCSNIVLHHEESSVPCAGIVSKGKWDAGRRISGREAGGCTSEELSGQGWDIAEHGPEETRRSKVVYQAERTVVKLSSRRPRRSALGLLYL